MLGKFDLREFESKEDLFEYVKQPGYGWDPEIPAVCFALEVHANKKENKFELELYQRTAWPTIYRTMEWNLEDAANMNSGPNIFGYTRAAYNGLNLLQIFAANSIMQRKFESPDAEIIMMTLPYKIDTLVTNPYNMLVGGLTGFYFVITLLPLVYYTVYSIAKEKETGLQ